MEGWKRMHTVQFTKDELVEALIEWKSELFVCTGNPIESATLEPEDNGIYTVRYFTKP